MTCELAANEAIRVVPTCAELLARLPLDRARTRRESLARALRSALVRLGEILQPGPVDLLDDYPEAQRARAQAHQLTTMHWVNR